MSQGVTKEQLVTIIAVLLSRTNNEAKIKREEATTLDGKQVCIDQIIGGDCDWLVRLRTAEEIEAEKK